MDGSFSWLTALNQEFNDLDAGFCYHMASSTIPMGMSTRPEAAIGLIPDTMARQMEMPFQGMGFHKASRNVDNRFTKMPGRAFLHWIPNTCFGIP